RRRLLADAQRNSVLSEEPQRFTCTVSGNENDRRRVQPLARHFQQPRCGALPGAEFGQRINQFTALAAGRVMEYRSNSTDTSHLRQRAPAHSYRASYAK